ncbi:stonustoxin subunit alpha-like [Spea bombifrons]|uniref:stonustoxin subunit alpha-like n=1 Tax=Spea bombifrons TaxID=233779 RepID=UPI00234B88F7|nr:stonustoxin subunit alpha-like [Spea bombifrons]
MTIEIPSLGRPFSLGMLYDCRDDSLVPGISFWKREALEKDISVSPQNSTSFEVITSDTVCDKSSALEMKAALKTSFLCGLVQVGGSAKFLNDTKRSEERARVTLKYSRTTKFTQLGVGHLCADDVSGRTDKLPATHIVTGILYGAQAFFIFDQDVSSSEKLSEVEGKLQAMVRRIPQLSNGDNKMTPEVKCTFYGDFALQTSQVTFDEVVKIYSSLPNLLGENGENAVPLRVWLHPLKSLDDKATRLVREISLNLFLKIEYMMQYMAEVDMQCNDLMRHPAAESFPDLKTGIRPLRENCKKFILQIQSRLSQTLPAIRGGEMDEGMMAEILGRKEWSPFREHDIKDFLSKTRKEMDFMYALRNALRQIQVISTKEKLREFFISSYVDYAVCFNVIAFFPVAPYLTDTSRWINESRINSTGYYQSYQYPSSSLWFEVRGMSGKVRQYVKEFQAFAQANSTNYRTKFVITSLRERNDPGISIYLCREGELDSLDFEPPSKPNPPSLTKITHYSVELSLQPAEFGRRFIEGYRVECAPCYTDKWVSLPVQKAEKVEFPNLEPGSYYQFRYSAVCKARQSQVSDVTRAQTLPTSPPKEPQTTADSSSIRVFWKAPSVVGREVVIRQYKLQYKEQSSDVWLEVKTATKTESHVIEGLSADTTYNIRVSAVTGNNTESNPSEEILSTTAGEEAPKVTESPGAVN